VNLEKEGLCLQVIFAQFIFVLAVHFFDLWNSSFEVKSLIDYLNLLEYISFSVIYLLMNLPYLLYSRNVHQLRQIAKAYPSNVQI
jgi:hypothetical protein